MYMQNSSHPSSTQHMVVLRINSINLAPPPLFPALTDPPQPGYQPKLHVSAPVAFYNNLSIKQLISFHDQITLSEDSAHVMTHSSSFISSWSCVYSSFRQGYYLSASIRETQ